MASPLSRGEIAGAIGESGAMMQKRLRARSPRLSAKARPSRKA